MANCTESNPGGEAPGAAGDFFVVDDTEAVSAAREENTAPGPESPTLNAARVRQLSALRRGTYRARSYCVIAIAVCAVAAGQLALMTVRHVRAAGWQVRPVGYVCGILAAMMACMFFVRRVLELTRELRPQRGFPVEPSAPEAQPDFSTLSDGSHAWKNLEQMREGS